MASSNVPRRLWLIGLLVLLVFSSLMGMKQLNYLSSETYKYASLSSEFFLPMVEQAMEVASNMTSSIVDAMPSDMLANKTLQSETEQETKSADEQKEERKPLNVLIIYPDDWRHDSLGAANPLIKTPFLDRLAKEGIRFTRNCVTTSICWISRATLFTGQHLARHKSQKLGNPVFYQHFNHTWVANLQRNDYFVGHIGKWQFRNKDKEVEKFFNWSRLFEGFHWLRGRHASDMTSNVTIDFLRQRPKDKPFALTVAFYPPKAIGTAEMQYFPTNATAEIYKNVTIPEPLNAEEQWRRMPPFFIERNEARLRWEQRIGTPERYQNSMRAYYSLITGVDGAAEKIYKELEDQGILNNTLIIFTTDNGFFHGEHGMSGKWYPFEESIRVPLIIRDPRMPKEARGTVDEHFTLNLDLASTIMGAANLEQDPSMQGRDISDLYLTADGKDTWRTEFFYDHRAAFHKKSIPASLALVRKDFKYMHWPQWGPYEQLYDLKNDPLEHNDIINETEYKDVLDEMRKRFYELQKSVQ